MNSMKRAKERERERERNMVCGDMVGTAVECGVVVEDDLPLVSAFR